MTGPGENTVFSNELAVIVINWNNASDTIHCLKSLASWEALRPDIYVVDNASTDDSLSRIEFRFPSLRTIRSKKNLGFAGGNNLGIRSALADGAREILLLNNDAEVGEASVLHMLGHLKARPDIAVIGPRIRTGDIVTAGGRDIGHNPDTHIPWEPAMGTDGLKNVAYVPGTVFLVRRESFEKVGMLDEDYFFSGEIADFCRRIQDAGLACCVDLGAEATHRSCQPSPIRNTVHAYYITRNRFLYVKKHYNGKRSAPYAWWTGHILLEIAFSAAHGDLMRSRAILLGLFDGLTGTFGNHNDRFIAQ